MTDKLRAAAKAALEALERSRAYVYETDRQQVDDAMDGLRAALAEQEVEQEPVAWRDAEPVAWADEIIEAVQAMYDTEGIREDGSGDALIRLSDAIGAVEDAEKRHPQRREWVSLTDEQIAVIASTPCAVVGSYVHTFARAIETALKERNT